jgi:YesN/AraC family two-component response regulator
MKDYLTKPLKKTTLKAMLDKHLNSDHVNNLASNQQE